MADESTPPPPDAPPEPSPEEGATPSPDEETPRAPDAGKPQGGTGKVHVDADWKAEAKAEKERLAREMEDRGRAAGPGAEAAAAAAGPARLPPASFAALVQTLATQAAIFLSGERDPETGRPLRNLDLAKHNIDLLSVLEEKTRGNLADEEKRLLDRYLYELRMAYVSAAS
ncbi:MAG: DUF1844 domain-containing protein [Phycisphaerae bacterium]